MKILLFKYNLNRNLMIEVIVKIRLKRISMQERIIVEALLNNGVIVLVMISEFAGKQDFNFKNKKTHICNKCR